MKPRIKTMVASLATLLISSMHYAQAMDYPLPAVGSNLVGENTTYQVPQGKLSLEDIAAKYQIGLLAMLEANPGTDPYLPKPGTVLVIPHQIILPPTPHEGIVVNLAELRLYYYPKDQNKVIVLPIGIGQVGRNTPEMVTSIGEKIPNPVWIPTENIRKIYLKQQGIKLPGLVPAGPDNPMGLYAMRLAAGQGHYLIHGTNANFGIGMRVSSGCIRLRPEDIESLFNMVPKGTRVQIINQPVKVDVEPDGKRYIEVHQPLSHSDKEDPQTLPIALLPAIKKFIKSEGTDRSMVKKALNRRSGMPIIVSEGSVANIRSEPHNGIQSVSR
jgi:lipoprotein-anchoring transpeptidase ErfK/SrfK